MFRGSTAFKSLIAVAVLRQKNKANAKKQRNTKTSGKKLKWKDDSEEDSEASDYLPADEDQVHLSVVGGALYY